MDRHEMIKFLIDDFIVLCPEATQDQRQSLAMNLYLLDYYMLASLVNSIKKNVRVG